MTDPMREANDYTDEALDRLAEITPDDIERAMEAWRDDAAGTGFEDLLDAESLEEPG